jgi:anti-sigma B factor antagonist
MKYNISENDGIVLIDLRSSLEGGADTFRLKDEVKNRLGAGERRFILDMTNAGFVNSTGIGVVVAVLSSLKGADGTLQICGVSDRARRAFMVTGAWQLFDVSETRNAALTALRP